MKTALLILPLAISFALFQSTSNTMRAQPTDIAVETRNSASEYPLLLEQSETGRGFDLAYCQWECRIRYGYDLPDVGGRSSQPEDSDEAYRLHEGTASYYQYYACLEDCSRRHWQELEKR